MDSDDCLTDLSIRSLGKTPRQGIESARVLEVVIQGEKYRVSIAMRTPTAQSSPLIVQLFMSGHTEQAEFITKRIAAEFQQVGPIESFSMFDRMTTAPVHRDDFADGVNKIESDLKRRFSSMAKIHASVSPSARMRSADVAEASRKLTGYLNRHKVVGVKDNADRVLNRAHSRLIAQLTERELRFFDYDLFEEVLTYEKDQQMQALADRAAGLISKADADYEAVHSAIRAKFAKIVRELNEKQKRASQSHRVTILQGLESVVKDGRELLKLADDRALNIEDPSDTTKFRMPFNIAGFRALAETVDRGEDALDDLAELNRLVKEAKIVYSQKVERSDPAVRINHNSSVARSEIEFLLRQMEWEFANDISVDHGRQLFYARQSVVAPSNGAPNVGGNLGEGAGLGESFITQPRRLNSGPGNRRERFDYDTPEFD